MNLAYFELIDEIELINTEHYKYADVNATTVQIGARVNISTRQLLRTLLP